MEEKETGGRGKRNLIREGRERSPDFCVRSGGIDIDCHFAKD
jgi:hypothetical protein